MSSVVHLLEPAPSPAADLAPPRLEGLEDLVRQVLVRARPGTGAWAVKTWLGPPQRPAAVAPAWAARVASALPDPEAAFCTDTLSITTAPLDTVAGHQDVAAAKGYGPGGPAPEFKVADDPDLGPAPAVDGIDLAAGTAGAAGLAVLTPFRPHPHAGFLGAITSLGLGLVDRAAKLELHLGIRPQVDTPLCAGCGSCLAVCLWDAIVLKAGRAMIDHEQCTGCGECMNACFMAGVAPEETAGIPRFQERVAEAAVVARRGTVAGTRPAVFLNFLVRRDRSSGGPARKRTPCGDLGVLVGNDPVAVDRAAWDLVVERCGGSLEAWSGFRQQPDALLERAEALGLGSSEHRLVRHTG
ncbi:MAG: DUF362 domain-containing protein [bacterium]|nr:DUF362 domain-containing protein [bacterium]